MESRVEHVSAPSLIIIKDLSQAPSATKNTVRRHGAGILGLEPCAGTLAKKTKRFWCVGWANFCGVNTLIVAVLKLPTAASSSLWVLGF